VFVVVGDVITKRQAVSRLDFAVPYQVIGDWVQFTLVYNSGAAFGTTVGDRSRWIFTLLAVAILFVLVRMAYHSRPDERWKLAALGLVCGGAIGNLIDRLRWTHGVVDFIDVGVRTHRFWVFNVADSAVSVGAAMLVVILWLEDRRSAKRAT